MPDEPPELEGRTPADLDVNRKQVAGAIKEFERKRGKGSVPQGISLLADEELAEPKISWLEHLERLAQAAATRKAGMADYTRSKPSRRQQAMATLEQQPLLPAMTSFIIEVCFVLDTSGSMLGLVEKLLAEAAGLLKSMGGARISFISCDAKVHEAIHTTSVSDMIKAAKGGGGTDFRPAFNAIADLKPKPDLVIFATDGIGDYPTESPAADVIWLVVPGGDISVSWGERIQLEESDFDGN